MNVMKMFDLSGRTAVISGTGNGLGYELAPDASSFTTGLMLVTDGGCMAK